MDDKVVRKEEMKEELKNMTLEEYIRELNLMKKQYGQEEELYPYIYMLLREVGITNKYSVRMVSGARRAKSVKGRELLMGYAAFPDIAILDEGFLDKRVYEYENEIKNIYCCVEAKEVNTDLLKIKKDFKIINKRCVCLKSSKGAWYRYYLMVEDNDVVEVKNKRGTILKKWANNKRNIMLNGKIVDDRKWFCINTGNVMNPKSVKEILDSEKNYVSIQKVPFVQMGDKYMPLCKENGKATDYGELIGELLWYGRVIYTNGYKWKYLTIKNGDDNSDDWRELRNTLYDTCVRENQNHQWCRESAIIDKEFKVNCTELIEIDADETSEDDWDNFKFKLRIISKEWKQDVK